MSLIPAELDFLYFNHNQFNGLASWSFSRTLWLTLNYWICTVRLASLSTTSLLVHFPTAFWVLHRFYYMPRHGLISCLSFPMPSLTGLQNGLDLHCPFHAQLLERSSDRETRTRKWRKTHQKTIRNKTSSWKKRKRSLVFYLATTEGGFLRSPKLCDFLARTMESVELVQ